ncbi:MAG: 3-phosphoshikimate 1-carboxyvinyltransferase [Acidimicrobiales bacterium]
MRPRPLLIDPLIRPPDVDLTLPGSKSITNRALVAASLASGTSVLDGPLVAEDTLAMVDCVKSLGAGVTFATDRSTLEIAGTGGRLERGEQQLWVRQSGTTARFVLAMAALAGGGAVVDGDEQIRARPQTDLVTALASLGIRVTYLGEEGSLPVRLDGQPVGGARVRVPGDTSSQFVSALLLIAPCISGGLTLELTGALVSRPYVHMTVEVMRAFGADLAVTDDRVFQAAGTGYRSRQYRIEPDASAASYFFAAAAVSAGRVAVNGLGSDSLQGDAGFAQVLAEMGADVVERPDKIEVTGTGLIEGVDVSMKDMSDTAPTLGAVAPLASAPVTVRGVGFMRLKESDRIEAVVNELQRLGIEATDDGDGFTVVPGTPVPTTVSTYDDHRMAMAFSVLGLVVPGISIADPQCVAKTFPEFFDALDELRAQGDATLAVLALDGPAGSGKSTVARAVATRLNLEYLDTGAMYRSVTLAALDRGLAPDDADAISMLARHVEIDVGIEAVTLDGSDVTAAIRAPSVNAAVSEVSAHPGVRAALRRQQRSWARRRGGGVLEGRDIGSVVFPDARLKVYVTASIEERARRRAEETGAPHEEVVTQLVARDRFDSSREDSPLVEAQEAHILDTTGLDIDGVVDRIVELFDE